MMRSKNTYFAFLLLLIYFMAFDDVSGSGTSNPKQNEKQGSSSSSSSKKFRKTRTNNAKSDVVMYKNELYAPNVQPGDGFNGSIWKNPYPDKIPLNDEHPVYDDYNADYNIPHTFSNYRKTHYTAKVQETREIVVKQGRLKGIVRQMHPQSGLKNIDQFLGIPYAEAPIGSMRFMPPGAPPPWPELFLATKFKPVCPQTLPDINNPQNTLSKGRYDQIKRLLPYLKQEDEDCLYLNLYVPVWDGPIPHTKLPVIVYIHGESYEWNSGNPYDGSILASYGQVIVVTVNYRLGILGFLKPGLSDHTVTNFGLLDQIAALQWIKENIEAFGGDNKAVTLMGHGTGAACINFLMISPVANGLFHRAILLSGSALSDWALAHSSVSATVQVAHELNCPLDDEELLQCLRKKRVADLMGLKVSAPEFASRFAPIIDGLVIPNAPQIQMGQHSDIFSRYDLLYGVTELESYHSLNAVSLTYGIVVNERDTILKFYMQNRFEMRPDLALAATLKEYTDLYTDNADKALAEEHRDTLLEILSDARVTAPLVQTGLYLSKVNPKCFMYVFSHNSEAGEYAHISQSVVGEELAYVFGAPLGNVGPFQPHYNQQERLFSEAIMKYWSNFAKTGNPKAPWRDLFFNMNPPDWRNYDVDWPEFNPINQSYLHLGITPIVSHRYRYKYMRFWNQELPAELTKQLQLVPPPKRTPPSFLDFTTKMPNFRRTTSSTMIEGHMNLFPMQPRPSTLEDPFKRLHRKLSPEPSSVMVNSPSGPDIPVKEIHNKNHIDTYDILKSESTLTLLIGIVLLFLVFNVFVIIGFVVRRQLAKRKLNRKYNGDLFETMTDEKRSKYNETDDSYIMDIMRRNDSNTYEAIKASRLSSGKGYVLSRQLSSSTVDAHTKVTDWISQDMTTCSSIASKRSISNNTDTDGVSMMQKPEKVNVAVDATDRGRGDSVLRQEPIELTKAKSMDYVTTRDIIICQEIDVDPIFDAAPVRFEHSEGQTMYPYPAHNHEKVTSFIDYEDVNVTSRDESAEREPLSPEESLRCIQRRNFPKVLPDPPDADDKSHKRLSLPPQYFMMHPMCNADFTKVPPAPPPRISSTLGRRPSNNRTSTFMTSPVRMAEEPPTQPEPLITVNTLNVGPLISKQKPETIYMSMHRMNSIQENQSNSSSISDLPENKEVPDADDTNSMHNCLTRQNSSTSDSSTCSSTGTIKRK